MTTYRSLLGVSLVCLAASGAAYAQQGAPGGSLYKDPDSKSYLPPRTDANKPLKAEKSKGSMMKSDTTNPMAPKGTTNGDGASAPGSAGLTGPKFGGG